MPIPFCFYTHKASAGLFYFYKKISTTKNQIKIHSLMIEACSKKLVIEFGHMLLSLMYIFFLQIYNNVALNKIKKSQK